MIRGPRRLEEVEIGAGCPGVIVQTNSFLRWNFAWEGSDGRVERVGVAEKDISEDDLRLQFDSMQIALAGIRRAGQQPPGDSTLMAMFDNSLPMPYSHIRQVVRRQAHATFLAHYTDYVTQVRAELASRSTTARAFSAAYHPPSGSGPSDSGPVGGSDPQICLRCGIAGHVRPKCTRPKTKCKFYGQDHLSALCEKAGAMVPQNGHD